MRLPRPAAFLLALVLPAWGMHVRIQAVQIIRDALIDLDPAGKPTFEKNAPKYIDDLKPKACCMKIVFQKPSAAES